MFRLAILTLLLGSIVAPILAQEQRVWTELTKKDTEKLLNDSPWARTQVETDTTEMFFTPTRPGNSAIGQPAASRSNPSTQQQVNNNRADQGATNQPVSVNYHIRLFSARPIREAISRMIVLESSKPPGEVAAMMQTMIDRDFSQYIVVTVTFDSTDGRFSGPAIQAFGSATTDTLRNKTYLERKDGKRLYLMAYRAPSDDGLGAKFVFERAPNGVPFVNDENGSLRFYSEVSEKIRLNVKYNIPELTYNGKLEY